MRPLSDPEIVTLTKDEHVYWHTLSDFSILSYVFIIIGVVLFLRDVVFDLYLVVTYAISGDWEPCIVISVILIAAAAFQSFHYYQDQHWIDANHIKLSSSRNEPNNWGTPTETETETNQTNNDANASFSSSTNCFPISISLQSRNFFRIGSQIFLLTPLYRAFACWKDRKEKEKIILLQRATRQRINRDEIKAAVTKSERDVTDQTLLMIENCFEALPQSILQIFFASRVGLTFQLDSSEDWFRIVSIAASLLFSAIGSTKYKVDYFKHLKTLHFQDYFLFGHNRHNTVFTHMSWTAIFFTFTMDLIIIAQRFYGIAVMFVLYGRIAAILLIVILYYIQFYWLQMSPSYRLVYENPPRGITTNYSNYVDRWMNLFTFHMLKPTVKILFFYNLAFIFSYSLSLMFCHTFINPFQNITFSNGTNALPINATMGNITANLTNTLTNNPATLSFDKFWTVEFVIYSWILSVLMCLVLGNRLEKELKPSLKGYPLVKGFPFWNDVMSCKKWDHVGLSVRRHICLCVLATDAEFYRVFSPISCTGILDRRKLDELWVFKLNRISSAVSTDDTELRAKWISVKNQRKHNTNLSELLVLVDSAFNDGPEVVPIKDLQMFLNLVENFEIRLTERSSFRLMNTDKFVKLVHPTDIGDL